jgi:hypothetical protein
MNQVEIKGGTKDKKVLAAKVVDWYLKKTMPCMRTLDITVKLTSVMERDGVYGYCFEIDPRTFEIEVDKNLRLYDFVSTLMHELTHLKQYARREMISMDSGSVRWKSKIYSSNTAYDDLPWEKEAFRVEKELALECFEAIL